MNKYYLIIISISAFLSFVSCTKNPEKKDTGGGMPRGDLSVEATVAVQKELDHTFTFTGTLLANEEVELRCETSGRVIGILFKEGSRVNKGQLLVKMNDSELQAQLKKNELQIELATDDEKRKTQLLKIKGISMEEYENSLNKLKTLQAEKQLLEAQIEKTEIRAPFAGTTGLRLISEGAYLSTATAITTLQQIDPIKIEFSVPEKFKNYLTINKEIDFTIEGTEKAFKAKVYAIEAKIDATTRTIKARALCANADNKLFPGAFANIQLNFFPKQLSIVIPARAIIPVLEGEQVFLIRNGKASASTVKTGMRTGTEIEIIEGVNVGDTLVTSGLLQIKDGMPVKGIVKNN